MKWLEIGRVPARILKLFSLKLRLLNTPLLSRRWSKNWLSCN